MDTASLSGRSALTSNVFKNLKIDKEDLVQKLPNDWDTKSAITSTSLKGLHLKKKDRKKLRHELLVQSMQISVSHLTYGSLVIKKENFRYLLTELN